MSLPFSAIKPNLSLYQEQLFILGSKFKATSTCLLWNKTNNKFNHIYDLPNYTSLINLNEQECLNLTLVKEIIALFFNTCVIHYNILNINGFV